MEDTATVDTPSTPSAPPTPSAPASSEPSVTTDRPSIGDALKTFNEAAKLTGRKQYGQKAAPAPATDPAAEATAAPVPEGTAEAPVTPPAKTGFIATADHIKAVENARTKARAEVESEYRSQYGDVAAMLPYARQFQTDRTGFLATILSEALQDPDLAPQVRSLAGQTLRGSQTPQAPAQTLERPEPDFVDGQGHAFYSAKQQDARDAWLIDQVKSQILGEVQPGLETVEQMRAQQEGERAQAQLQRTMTGHLTEARSAWPYFKEHEPAIKAELAKAPLTSGHPAEEALLLRRVYDRVVGPIRAAEDQKRIVADLQSRAHASTLNPASTGAPSGIPKTVRAKDGGTMGAALKWAAAQNAGR